MSDEKILKLMKRSENEGFEALVHRYSGYVRTIAISKLGSAAAEDAVNGVFFEILKALRREKYEIRSLKALVSVIAVRHCSGLFSEQMKQEALPIDEQFFEPMYEEAYDRAELIASLKSLGEPDCEIFLRKYFLGQTSAEIGAALGLKTNTVDQRISRGLRKLRDMMEG
ncbi:MAG: RNA polymerase sigma factor [Ruminococcus sp.]|nr:RNA polymerase sigma factor [Ruminococcus sp.]MBR4622847.1 RNA polymerase sigma factor [Ruminococcus sp.]